jgi:hypothetical protein
MLLDGELAVFRGFSGHAALISDKSREITLRSALHQQQKQLLVAA